MKRLIVIFAVISLTSCWRSDECDPYKNCNTENPDSAWVNVSVTFDANGPGIPIVIYNGYVEDEVVVLYDTLYSSSTSYYLPVREFYSLKAIYQKGSQKISAYDGGKVRVTKFWNCDNRCYEVNELNLNAALLQ